MYEPEADAESYYDEVNDLEPIKERSYLAFKKPVANMHSLIG